METNETNLLNFDGRKIPYAVIENEVFIPIRPLCDILQVEYNRQYKKLNKDKIMGRALYKCTMRDAENRMRTYVTLPERYIYGWLFTISSDSNALYEYKVKCHDVLYNYFRGELTRRNELLRKKALTESEIKNIQKDLRENSEKYKRLNELQGEMLKIGRELKKNDNKNINKQLRMFN